MKNEITITIPFSFKGEEFKPSAIIDLDVFCLQNHDLEMLGHLVATKNKIGNHSYEYEVLHSSEHLFSNATGLAKDYLNEEKFDLASFKIRLEESKIFTTLCQIAHEKMGIEKLDLQSDLYLALKQAYEAGKSETK